MGRLTRPLALLIAAVALLAAAPAFARPAPAPAAISLVGPGDIYLALGDSLTTGTEATVNNDRRPGYPEYFYTALQQTRPISYTLLGVSGETSATMRAPGGQLERAVGFLRAQRAAGKVVSPITLDIGGNDIMGVILPTSTPRTVTETLSLYRANLEVILDTLVAELTVNGARTGDLLLLNHYNPYPGMVIRSIPPFFSLPAGQEPIVTEREVAKFNAVVAEEAAERGLPVFDTYSAFLGREAELTFVRIPAVFPPNPFSQDNLERNYDYHPREAGHRVLARGLLSIGGYPTNYLMLPLVR